MKEIDYFTEYGDANRYQIVYIFGKGSYGVVCAAIDTHTGENAIKKINDVFEYIWCSMHPPWGQASPGLKALGYNPNQKHHASTFQERV